MCNFRIVKENKQFSLIKIHLNPFKMQRNHSDEKRFGAHMFCGSIHVSCSCFVSWKPKRSKRDDLRYFPSTFVTWFLSRIFSAHSDNDGTKKLKDRKIPWNRRNKIRSLDWLILEIESQNRKVLQKNDHSLVRWNACLYKRDYEILCNL